MQLDGKTILANGWLVSGDASKYTNTPLINVANIEGVTYYEDKEMNANGEYLYPGDWYIMFSEKLKWCYESREKMYETYQEIVVLLTKAGEKQYI